MLTGVPAGEANEEGNYPPETINGLVQAQLARLAEERAAFSASVEEEE